MKSIIIIAIIINIINGQNTDIKEKEFYIAVKQNRNGVGKLEQLIKEISDITSINYGKYLTIEEINKIIEPNIEYIKNVKDYVEKRNIRCDILGDGLRCKGQIRDINKLLNVRIMELNINNKLIYISKKNYEIPKKIADYIDFIDGISNKIYPMTTKKVNIRRQPLVDSGSVSREVLMRVYNLNPTNIYQNNSNPTSVGAIEYEGNDGFNNDHLIASEKENGVDINPISPEHTIGVVGTPDMESELDVQVMYWGASNAELWYEVARNWMYSWALDFANRDKIPEVISLSWGWSELDQCSVTICDNITSQIYVTRTNIEFIKILLRGTTIVTASGDAGSPGRTNEGCVSYNGPNGWNHINAIFPGGSKWVLSVGATYLIESDNKFNYTTPICTTNKYIQCANGLFESMTTYEKTRWTSGSGFNHWDTTPYWQKEEVKNYLEQNITFPDSIYYNKNGRAYPDVSAFGHNCPIKDQYGWDNIDGTSCSSPIFAGIIANLNAFQKSRNRPILGYVNPLLYKIYREDKTTFNDITTGYSGCTESRCCSKDFGFHASEGWDAISGLGTPNVENIKRYLVKNT